MENILTIKFNTLDELATQVAEWNERLNHQCQCQCMSGSSLELAESKLKDTFKKAAQATDVKDKPTKAKKEEKTKKKEEKKPVEEVKAVPVANETPTAEEIPVVDFTEEKQQEKVDAHVEEIDVIPFDPKAFWVELLTWMGKDGQRATSALKIFRTHGIEKPSSSQLTDDIVNELKALMAA
ncbi:choline-binding protein A [Veillonella montpellierensis]|uniref:choline-binding protein A n=1 Tax=Veillonella montpellierensis TaxID=187328 RepID=UPI0023F72122|nr:choline-binding protein A [Veillonella montpellierensis]